MCPQRCPWSTQSNNSHSSSSRLRFWKCVWQIQPVKGQLKQNEGKAQSRVAAEAAVAVTAYMCCRAKAKAPDMYLVRMHTVHLTVSIWIKHKDARKFSNGQCAGCFLSFKLCQLLLWPLAIESFLGRHDFNWILRFDSISSTYLSGYW